MELFIAPVGFLAFIVFVVTIWASVRIIRRAGFSGWWVLIGFVPVVNIAMIWVFALGRWPREGSRGEDEGLWSPGSLRDGDGGPPPTTPSSPPAQPQIPGPADRS